MRKFSKKIAMMMVLAMLVSLFSGIVSASAASMWSAKSVDDDNYAVVMGETIEVKKGEFINFDLFKNDVEATEAGYTYTWESSDAEVLFINGAQGAKNGYARVKGEVGEKATISVSFTNLATGVTVKTPRTFNVVVVEELKADEAEVEYAIVPAFGEETFVVGAERELKATVTADGKEVEAEIAFAVNGKAIEGKYVPAAGDTAIVITATVAGKTITETFDIVVEEVAGAPEFVSTKQTATNAVEIVLNDAAWAAKAVADNAITAARVYDAVEVAELVKSVVAKKDAADTVVVTFYNNLAADATYTFAFAGYECEATVVGANNTPVRIEVVGGQVPANSVKEADIKVYNSLDIDITSLVAKNVTYTLLGENYDCDVQSNGSIYFFEVGKQAVIKAVFDMGWDNDGNEIADLEATGTYYSVDEFKYTGILGFALSDGTKKAKDLTYGNSVKLSLSDPACQLYATYDKIPYEGDKTALYIIGGEGGYTYYSTNESVVLVNSADGTIYPCKAGYASIYLKKDDKVVASVSIEIQAARKLGSFSASIADKKLATAIPSDNTQISVTTKDQFGGAYGNVSYDFTLDTRVAKGSGYATMSDLFAVSDPADGKITLTLKADAATLIGSGNTPTLVFTAKAIDKADSNNTKSVSLSVSVRNNVGAAAASTTLTVSAKEIDTALNKKTAADYESKITLVKVDDKSYDLGLQEFAFEAAATTGSAYSVVITKVGDDTFDATDSDFFAFDGNTITISPVLSATDKLASGTYKVQLYKLNGEKMQAIKNETIIVKDSTPAVSAVVKSANLAGTTIADVLEFYINGAKVDAANIDSVIIKDQVNAVSGKTYVKTVTVTLKTTALNGDSELGYTFEKDIAIGQLFTTE